MHKFTCEKLVYIYKENHLIKVVFHIYMSKLRCKKALKYMLFYLSTIFFWCETIFFRFFNSFENWGHKLFLKCNLFSFWPFKSFPSLSFFYLHPFYIFPRHPWKLHIFIKPKNKIILGYKAKIFNCQIFSWNKLS